MKHYISILFLVLSSHLFAQITSSEIRGQLKDETKSGTMDVTVKLVHQPTQTSFATLTDVNGNFFFPQLKSGGPYSIIFQYTGYKTISQNDLYLVLGETKYFDIQLEPQETELEEVVLKIDQNAKKKGAEFSLGEDQIAKLPTLNRSLQDVTRLTPQTSGNSYLGSNYRYNNLSIDGTANNDAFGFQEPSVGAGGSTAAGSPGALSKTQPISLDAIGEVQVALSPYDVKLGNFTGGSLNVVTKSGTNNWETSIYGFGRNKWSTGRSADASRSAVDQFYDAQTGFRVGGPLRKDKLFLFVNAEAGRRLEPVQSKPGTDGSAFQLADIQALYDTVKSRYGYDLGSFGDMNVATYNNKFFTRLDWNINAKNQLALRYNFVQGVHESMLRSNTLLNYGNQGFTHHSLNNSAVLELKSRIGKKWFNNLIVGANRIHDYRETPGDIFPHIEITYNTGSTLFLGSYREAVIYQMKQKSYELSDNVSVYLGKHKLTMGTHSELYDFDYHFVTPWNGRWAYRSIQDFYDNKPSRVRGTYHLTDDSYAYNYNRPSADFSVLLSALYLQDDWAPNAKLKVSYGMRLDGNFFLTEQNTSTDLRSDEAFKDFRSGIKNQFILSPRVGFNYDVTGSGNIKLRGGAGVFAGRVPFAFTAYSYIYNGNQFGNIDYRPSSGTVVPLISSDFGQMANLQPGRREINVVDQSFKLPRVLRGSLATDLKLPGDVSLTLEGVYTKTLFDVLFQTKNLKDSTVTISGNGADNREVYIGSGSAGLVNPDYTSVFLLTNTKLGYRYSLSATLSKRWTNKGGVMVAYNYGQSKDVSNGVRVSPQANWEWNQTINPNQPSLSYSNFDIRHRIIASVDYEKQWSKKHKSFFTAVLSAQSGSPFSFIYNGDLNRDGSPTNDLIYVPAGENDIHLVDITNADGSVKVSAADQWQQLDAYISSNPYLNSKRGQTVERNGARTPWNAQLDVRMAHEVTVEIRKHKHQLQLTADIFNVLNAINYRWCQQYFVPNTTNAGYSLLTVKSVSSSTGAATFQFNNPTTTPWQIDQLASRLQAQIGIRYSF